MSSTSLNSDRVAFTFVNQMGRSVAEKPDEEDLAIIKSHAMRAVHRQRRSIARATIPSQSPPAYPSTDWDHLALTKFFEDFVFPKPTTTGNAFRYFDFLPIIYKRHTKDTHLTNAVLAVALAHFANLKSADCLHPRAERSYACSLTLVNRSLANPVEMGSDEVLTTLCLLNKYEIVNGQENKLWRVHENGQAALVNYRGQAQLETEVGRGLFRLIYIRQQLNCIARSESPPERPAFNWDAAFPSPYLKQLMLLVSRLVGLRHRARPFTNYDLVEDIVDRHVWREAHSLDEDLLNFGKYLPPDLQYWTVNSHDLLPAVATGVYFPELLHLFHDIHHASIWQVYSFCQIYLLQTIIHLASHPSQQMLSSPETSTLPRLHQRLHQAIDNVCASAPFLLGWSNNPLTLNSPSRGQGIACHYTIWVLAAALSVHCPHVPEGQRDWIRARLREIGFVHGIRQALVFA